MIEKLRKDRRRGLITEFEFTRELLCNESLYRAASIAERAAVAHVLITNARECEHPPIFVPSTDSTLVQRVVRYPGC